MKSRVGNRINVVGTTGSGKTTFASCLAEILNCSYIELDALWWDANWTNPSAEEFRERVRKAVQQQRWVVDGNYSKSRDIVWARADTIIWLDFPLWLIMYRLTKRTIQRVVDKQELWNGNRERLSTAFHPKDSLFVWALKTYGRRKREYSQLLGERQYSQLEMIRFRAPQEARDLLQELQAAVKF